MNKIIHDDIDYIINCGIDFSVLKNKSILITGANGMLASYIIMTILMLNTKYKYNINIIPVIRNRNKFYQIFKDFIIGNEEYINIIEIDINEINENICDNISIDYIIHAASPSQSHQFLEKPLDVIYTNVFATDILLKIAKKNNIKSFLYFSSLAVYGEIEDGYFIENKFGGIDPLEPRSVYSESKRMSETLCNSYYKQYNIPIKIIRIGHTYGCNIDLNRDSRIFSEFIKNIINNENIIIKGNPNSLRSYCYIVDAIIAYFQVLLEGYNGEAYNIVNNRETYSVLELAKILISICIDKNIEISYSKHDQNYVSAKEVDNLNNFHVNTNKIESIGWNPKYNVRTGFKRVIDFFEEEKRREEKRREEKRREEKRREEKRREEKRREEKRREDKRREEKRREEKRREEKRREENF